MSASWWVSGPKKPCSLCGHTWSQSGDHPGCLIDESKPTITVRVADNARHLRGRVYVSADGKFYAEVVNRHTGEAINHDGPFGLLRYAMDDCTHRVLCARGAWMYGYRQRALK